MSLPTNPDRAEDLPHPRALRSLPTFCTMDHDRSSTIITRFPIWSIWENYFHSTQHLWQRQPGIGAAGLFLCWPHAELETAESRDRSVLALFLSFCGDLLLRSKWRPRELPEIDVLLCYPSNTLNTRSVIERIADLLLLQNVRCALLSPDHFRILRAETGNMKLDTWWSEEKRQTPSIFHTIHSWIRALRDWNSIAKTLKANSGPSQIILSTPMENIRHLAQSYMTMENCLKILSHLRPKVLLVTHERWSPLAEMVFAAREGISGLIKTNVYQHGLCSLFDLPFVSDQVLLWNQDCWKAYSEIGVTLHRYEIVGNAELDVVLEEIEKLWTKRISLRSEMKINVRQKVFLFLSQSSGSSKPKDSMQEEASNIAMTWLSRAAIEFPEWVFLVKPHPQIKSNMKISEQAPTNIRIIDKIYPFSKSLIISDVVGSISSAGMFIAAGAGKPVIRLVPVPGEAIEGAVNVLDNISLKTVTTVDAFIDALRDITCGTDEQGTILVQPDDDSAFPFRGISVHRIAELCKQQISLTMEKQI